MEEIKRLISENKLEEAIRLLDAYLTEQPRSDEAWFLLGKAHYKLGNVRLALNSYLQAIEINPESPAQAAYDMAIKVQPLRRQSTRTQINSRSTSNSTLCIYEVSCY